jgi:hypothetical protein
MTPMGFFKLLAMYPQHTLILDDVTELFKKVEARQIFLAALDGEPGQARPVHYVSHKTQGVVQFSGGIIAISNLPLKDDPVLNALKSRIVPLEHEPSDEHLAAFMLQLAEQAHGDMTPDQCQEVVQFLIAEQTASEQRLDLRLRLRNRQRRKYELQKSEAKPDSIHHGDWCQDLICLRRKPSRAVHCPQSLKISPETKGLPVMITIH